MNDICNPEPTKTFVLDIGRKCNINCKFCYHHHLGDLSKQGWKPISDIYKEISEGIQRGNNRVEFTGGEPTMYFELKPLVRLLKRQNIEVCIITNGIIKGDNLYSLIDAGVDEFLVSVHGIESTHNLLTQFKEARQFQDRTLAILSESNLKKGFRFNYVINAFNQNEIYDTAQYMKQWKPTMVNFINMNPHHGWMNDEATKGIIANLNNVESNLNSAICYLESNGIGVNVRYYPMCRIAEEYRRCICNDLHVMLDPKEWDYWIFPKTYEKYRQWGIDTSNNVEEKGQPCCNCDLQWVCGGSNKYWHDFYKKEYGEVLRPQSISYEGFDKSDFYFYRRNNHLTLQST